MRPVSSRRSGVPATSSWGLPIPSKPSVVSRFRLAGISAILGIALVAVVFYAVFHAHFLGMIITRTLGPYSDSLAEHGFASDDPQIWQKMAAQHDVAILIEPPDGEASAFDGDGRSIPPSRLGNGQTRAVRTAEDGTRVTLYWTVWSVKHSHMALMGGLVVLVAGVVGATFWLLQRQLKPLAWLRSGVDAVARGDFTVRVPVVRADEIGQVAGAFNVMANRVGEMIDDRERLLADVSHELRSPIARMKVALEFMPEGDKRDALDQDLKEMETLIATLLEREAMRSRAGRIEGQQVDLRDVAGEVVAALDDRGPGVEILEGQLAPVHADPALLKLLVQNLVENAVKFSRKDSKPVQLRLDAEAGGAVLRVIDDGIGIPEGSEERLFEPFVKSDRARGHRVGYGIGLNLCQRIVQSHGGEIRLLRRQPRGTEARVTLPGVQA